MMLTARSVSDLLAAFRSSDPTPGGGSAAALAGAVGASLLAMVASLPRPHTLSDAEASRLEECGVRSTALARRLEALIDRDTEAYDMVVSAYRLPKSTDEDKRARSAKIQEALVAATDAPLEVMRGCAEALSLAGAVAGLGNQNAASDVKVAIAMLRAGLTGARENVEINLGSVKDAAYVSRVRSECDRLTAAAG